MTVVDEGRMLLIGQGQGQDHGRSGLNNVDIKAEADVREQESDAFVIVERVFCMRPPSFFLHINCNLTCHLISFVTLLLGSNPSHESGG